MKGEANRVHPAELFKLLQQLATHNAARIESAGMKPPPLDAKANEAHEYILDIRLRVNEDALRDFGRLFGQGKKP
jgi:hypothetical protein